MDKELLYVLAGLGALILLSRKAQPTEQKPEHPIGKPPGVEIPGVPGVLPPRRPGRPGRIF